MLKQAKGRKDFSTCTKSVGEKKYASHFYLLRIFLPNLTALSGGDN
jgi:hypothetical protein